MRPTVSGLQLHHWRGTDAHLTSAAGRTEKALPPLFRRYGAGGTGPRMKVSISRPWHAPVSGSLRPPA